MSTRSADFDTSWFLREISTIHITVLLNISPSFKQLKSSYSKDIRAKVGYHLHCGSKEVENSSKRQTGILSFSSKNVKFTFSLYFLSYFIFIYTL